MIISASRRTDIPAFYSEWFINRVREGYCCVANPFNTRQVSRISLRPEDVDVIVFWTKAPKPFLKYLKELNSMGLRYYFQYTLTGYSKVWEPSIPDLKDNIETFKRLSEEIGKDKVIWRYDPIILSNVTDYDYHYRNFIKLADELKYHTERIVISILDEYRGEKGRIAELKKTGIDLIDKPSETNEFKELMCAIASCAKDNNLEIYSCAEAIDLKTFGIQNGKCIDGEYIKNVFGIETGSKKDRNQRKECGCIESKDIGAYDTCLNFCRYCYANRSENTVRKNWSGHRVDSPSITGWYECK